MFMLRSPDLVRAGTYVRKAMSYHFSISQEGNRAHRKSQEGNRAHRKSPPFGRRFWLVHAQSQRCWDISDPANSLSVIDGIGSGGVSDYTLFYPPHTPRSRRTRSRISKFVHSGGIFFLNSRKLQNIFGFFLWEKHPRSNYERVKTIHNYLHKETSDTIKQYF